MQPFPQGAFTRNVALIGARAPSPSNSPAGFRHRGDFWISLFRSDLVDTDLCLLISTLYGPRQTVSLQKLCFVKRVTVSAHIKDAAASLTTKILLSKHSEEFQLRVTKDVYFF